MTQVPMDDPKLKALFKAALVEVLEDIALSPAIEEGRRTEEVSRGEAGCSAGVLTRVPGVRKNTSASGDSTSCPKVSQT